MAEARQILEHLEQPTQISRSTYRYLSFSHVLAGHLLAFMWDSYLFRKFLMVLRTGEGAVLPKQQSEVERMVSARSVRLSTSDYRPSPATIRSKIMSIRLVPSRQGTQLPQDSRWVKPIKKRASSTMQAS